ncbi:unnamed protein product [Acanthosepion pharaonis]|uniref:Uncharacterized protein n=1 Tax=Acanthosepion pharaonis TaxID=158019 RepID=A0A812CUH5_ACAPH|nr:unnamed protein product [Sepia pharaonis]
MADGKRAANAMLPNGLGEYRGFNATNRFLPFSLVGLSTVGIFLCERKYVRLRPDNFFFCIYYLSDFFSFSTSFFFFLIFCFFPLLSLYTASPILLNFFFLFLLRFSPFLYCRSYASISSFGSTVSRISFFFFLFFFFALFSTLSFIDVINVLFSSFVSNASDFFLYFFFSSSSFLFSLSSRYVVWRSSSF